METLQSMKTIETPNDGLRDIERTQETQETHVRTENREIIEFTTRSNQTR